MGEWLVPQSSGNTIAVNGKVLRGSKKAGGRPIHLVSALLRHEQIVVSQKQVDKKSNEITAFKHLLAPLDLKGKIVTADAIQTLVKNARFVVEDIGVDYIFPVKQNQAILFEAIRNIAGENFSHSGNNN